MGREKKDYQGKTVNLIDLASKNDDIFKAYIATGRVSRPYLQRKYMISFSKADALALDLEKIIKDSQGGVWPKAI